MTCIDPECPGLAIRGECDVCHLRSDELAPAPAEVLTLPMSRVDGAPLGERDIHLELAVRGRR